MVSRTPLLRISKGIMGSFIFALALLSFPSLAHAADFTWDGGGDGTSWSDATNWDLDSGFPDDNTDTATIGTGSASISTSGDITVGAVTVNGTYAGTITLGGSLTADDAGGGTGNITIDEGTLQTGKDITSNITADGTFSIGTNGTVVVRRSSTTGEGAGQTITAGTLTITGTMHADGEGFDAGTGSGFEANSGGSHGGVGGSSTSADTDGGSNAGTYGSMTDPTSLGSGGSNSAGGGAITISSGGTVTVAGTLSAKGVDVARTAGAGGSINISADTLTGSGTISADGGNATGGSTQGGGGGGRISLNGVTTDTFEGSLQANGGTITAGGDDQTRGFAGTIYLNSAKRSSLTLGGAGNLSTLRLGSDDSNNYTFGSITIESGGTLEMSGNPNMNSGNGGAATINVTALDVQSGGTLSANNLGFSSTKGPGGSNRTALNRTGLLLIQHPWAVVELTSLEEAPSSSLPQDQSLLMALLAPLT